MNIMESMFNVLVAEYGEGQYFTTEMLKQKHFPGVRKGTLNKCVERLKKERLLEDSYGMLRLSQVSNLTTVISAAELVDTLTNLMKTAKTHNKSAMVYLKGVRLTIVEDVHGVATAMTFTKFMDK